MTAAQALTEPGGFLQSVFTGADVCHEAGLTLPQGVRRPNFDDDLWDLTDVVGLPVQLALRTRRFDFAAIDDPRWRLVGKELVMALLAPPHEAVASLPRAYRTPHHVSTCHGRLSELIRFLNWLPTVGVSNLADLHSDDCDAYLAHRRYPRDEHDVVVGERSPGTRRLAALIVTDLLNYRDLFTADRVPADLRPWGGATPTTIAEESSGRGQNKTPPVADEVFQPILAAALHLVTVLGPHAVELAQQLNVDRAWSVGADGLKSAHPRPACGDHGAAGRLRTRWPATSPAARASCPGSSQRRLVSG